MCVSADGRRRVAGDLTTRFEHDFVVTGLPDLPGPYAVQPPDALMIGRPAYDGDGLPQDRPHLILTTGTTGTPRAVRHDWKRLVSAGSNSSDSPGQRWLLAYGMNQFGGLQVPSTCSAPAPPWWRRTSSRPARGS